MGKLFLVPVFFAFAVILFGCTQPAQSPVPAAYHVHADFKVILDGQMVDFNKPQYMSVAGHEPSDVVHLHDFNPFVIHFHSADASLGDFFRSLGMDFNRDCFFDGNKSYCTETSQYVGAKTLQFYVNGAPNTQFDSYKPADLDKLLIFYGSGSPTAQDFNSITSWACVYSQKCPAPPGISIAEENCVGTNVCKLA